jgi:uncharacterized protein
VSGWRRRRWLLAGATLALALALLGAPRLARAAETPIPPPPADFVTDRAGFLSAATASELEQQLRAYQRGSGHQLLVYIDHTTGGVPIEDWAVRAFERWRVGRRGIDDGLVMFIFSDDRRARIEVGYGLEPKVPDALAFRIIDERVAPLIRSGDRDGAVLAGVAALRAAIGGASSGPAPVPGWVLVVGGILLLVLLGFAVTHPSLAMWMLFEIGSRGRGGGGWGGDGGGWGGGGGGWGGGGGGFSGGGGRSGGGGASGSW